MSNPVVLITGALTGIGRAAALAFAKEGSRIVVSGRHEEAGQGLTRELHALGAEAEFIRADVRHDDELRELVDRTVARSGRLDAAVNTAGTEGHPGPVTEQSADSYAATFDTNVLGTLLSMKHELRVMQAQGSGSIINISSTYGHLGARGASVYSASKRAVAQDGNVLDILVQSRRSATAAGRFFRKLLKGLQYVPRVIVTDKLKSYGAAKRKILPSVEHRQSRYLNNRAEVSHQPTRRRERQMKRFKSARHAQRFLSTHSRIHNHFQLCRHHLSANQYRVARDTAFRTWRDDAGTASAA